MYGDLFDMKKRELDEYAEVCAKEAEQKNESESNTHEHKMSVDER